MTGVRSRKSWQNDYNRGDDVRHLIAIFRLQWGATAKLRKASPQKTDTLLPPPRAESESALAAQHVSSLRPPPVVEHTGRQELLETVAMQRRLAAAMLLPTTTDTPRKLANVPTPPKHGDLHPCAPVKEMAAVGVSLTMVPQQVDGSETKKRGQSVFLRLQASPWITSFAVHIVLLFVLTLLIRGAPAIDTMVLTSRLLVSEAAVDEELEEFMEFEITELEVAPIEDVVGIEDLFRAIDRMQLVGPKETDVITAMVDPMDHLTFATGSGDLIRLLPPTISVEHQSGNEARGKPGEAGGNANAGDGAGGELGGRATRRIKFATPEMNYAIDHGLIWLARHQLADGGWGFDHRFGDCQGRCPNPGSKRGARIAATGLALLPFLGAGHSPDHGEYRQTVSAGIMSALTSIIIATMNKLKKTKKRWYRLGSPL